MKIKVFVGFVLGVALTTAIFLVTNVGAIVQDPEPIITAVSPTVGYTTGGEAVTITGRYFDNASEVLFGGVSAQIQTASTNALVVVTPAHAAGFVDVSVTNPIATITAPNSYEYIVPPPPSVISLSPTSGSVEGGTSVIIAGTFLAEAQSVTFDGLPGTIVSTSDSLISVLSPAHDAGLVDVIVTSPYGTMTIAGAFEFIDDTPPPTPLPPSISSLNPTQGTIEGGTEVTIFGTNLGTVTRVLFDSLEATIINAGETELIVTTPAHAIGPVSITVENPDGSSFFENGFTYTETTQPPTYVYCDWHDNGNNWKELKYSFNGKNDHKKALVCHRQSKPKNTSETLCLPLEAIPAHLAHGDEPGYCANDDSSFKNKEGMNNGKDGYEKGNEKGESNKKTDDKKDDKESGWKFWKR